MSWVTVDTSDVERALKIFEAAAERVERVSDQALTAAVVGAAGEAIRNASAPDFRDTGATADGVQWDTSGEVRRIGSPTRAAWFNEVGSPNTGAPNPWLSAPARRAAEEMFDAISGEAQLP